MAAKDLGPLDYRVPIVDGGGRPSPEFQRRWNTQRNNNGQIGFLGEGSGAPTDPPSGDGQAYVDISATPPLLYASKDGDWLIVGVVSFTQLSDVPSTYAGAGGMLARVTVGEDALEFTSISDVLDVLGAAEGAILYRAASGWAVLAPGTAGDVLSTNGAGADPAWVPQSGGGGGGGGKLVDGNPVNLPALASLTWLNQGGAAAVQHSGGPISLTIPAQNADQLRGLYQAPPAAPWTLTCKISPSLWPVNFYTGGVFITDGTKLVTFNIGYAGPSIQVVQWNGVTSFSSAPFSKASVQLQIMWLRIYHDGTTLHFLISQNGADWVELYSQSAGAWLGTITGAGVYGDNNDTTGLGFPSITPIWSFELTSGTGTDSTWGGGGGSITIVQHAVDNNGSINSITLSTAPTLGNLLVAIYVGNTTPLAGSGWTRVLSGAHAGVYTKTAGAGESTTQTPLAATDNGLISMFELTGASAPSNWNEYDAQSGSAINHDQTAAATSSIIIGAILSAGNTDVPSSMTGATLGNTHNDGSRGSANFYLTTPISGTNVIASNWPTSESAIYSAVVEIPV